MVIPSSLPWRLFDNSCLPNYFFFENGQGLMKDLDVSYPNDASFGSRAKIFAKCILGP